EDVVVISSDKVEGSGDWNSSEFQDTAKSRKKKETKGMVFYQMETGKVSDRFVAPCFVNGLEAYDGEINLGVEENMISNEYAVGTITIYPHIDPFLGETKEKENSNDNWDHLLDFNLDDVPLLGGEGLSPFVCRMGKSNRNKKRAMKNLNFFYHDIGTSSLAGGHEDKVKLDGKIVKEEEDAVKRIKGEALKEKDDPGAFIFSIRLEGKVNKNALADTGCWSGFPRTIGDIVNIPKRLFSTFNGFCHQTFRAARYDVMRNEESDSDDEEDYQIKRNKFRAPIYALKPAPYLNCNDPAGRSLAIETVTNPFWKISVWKKAVSFLGSLPVPLKNVNWKPDYKGLYTKEEEAKGKWQTEIRLTDPYENIYLQGFTMKKTDRKLSNYHKLSDIMSPN
nr:hypothetical protein [Tanacetum cinerariifolium]